MLIQAGSKGRAHFLHPEAYWLLCTFNQKSYLNNSHQSQLTPHSNIYLGLQSPLATVWVDLGSETLPRGHPSCSEPMRTSACAKRPSWASLLEPLVSSLPLSEDVEETWHRPEVSVTKLYYHNPIKCVWGLMSSSSVWEEGRWGLAVGGWRTQSVDVMRWKLTCTLYVYILAYIFGTQYTHAKIYHKLMY